MNSVNGLKTLPAKNLRRITAYLEPELYKELEELAASDKRSISQMVAVLVEKGILKAKREKKKDD